MARPALGRQARTVVGSTKISALEKEILEQRYGTVHAGLRIALDQLVTQPVKRSKKANFSEKSEPIPTPVEAPAGVVPCRIHRHYKVVRRWVDRGQEWTLKRCEDCGFENTVLDHGHA